MNWISLLIFVTGVSASHSANCVGDPVPLGLETGLIGSDQITATSSFEPGSVGPDRARLHHEGGGGAWCPKGFVDHTGSEFLEIDLGSEEVLVTGVMTQGRFASGVGQEYAEAYSLRYWIEDRGEWAEYEAGSNGLNNSSKSKIGTERRLLKGNSDTYSVAVTALEPAILTKRLRVVPFSHHPRTVCMRLELVGCHTTQVGEGFAVVSKPTEDRKKEIKQIDVDLADLTQIQVVDKVQDAPVANSGDQVNNSGFMSHQTMGIILGALLTVTAMLLLAIVLILTRASGRFGGQGQSRGGSKFSTSLYSIASSVLMERKQALPAEGQSLPSSNCTTLSPLQSLNAATDLENSLWTRLMDQSCEPVYQEPMSPTVRHSAVDYGSAPCSTHVTAEYSTPVWPSREVAGQVSATGYSESQQAMYADEVYHYPAGNYPTATQRGPGGGSFCTEFSYLEESSVDTLSSSSGTPRLPPLPDSTPPDFKMAVLQDDSMKHKDYTIIYVNQNQL